MFFVKWPRKWQLVPCPELVTLKLCGVARRQITLSRREKQRGAAERRRGKWSRADGILRLGTCGAAELAAAEHRRQTQSPTGGGADHH
jgi:hypothetical protein